MSNLVLITSVIKTPDIPFSYSSTRSVFNHDERFNQTIKTIEAIKKYIPNSKILIVECSDLNDLQESYLKKNCDFILNLYKETDIHDKIFSKSKALGEGTLTIKAIEFLQKNNLNFDTFIKISGRYYLNDNFNYDIFINNNFVFKKINNNINNIFTGLYKLPYNEIELFKHFLISKTKEMENCIGYENLMGEYIKILHNKNIVFVNTIGLEGYVSVGYVLYTG